MASITGGAPLPEYIEHLERFCTVAKCIKNGTATSMRSIIEHIRLDVSISRKLRSLTYHLAEGSIDELEKMWNVPLIYKVRSGENQLTTEGEALFLRAERILEHLRELQSPTPGPTRVSISRMILSSIAPDVMRAIGRPEGDGSSNIIFDDGHNTTDLIGRFRDDDIDLAILWHSEDRRIQATTAKLDYDLNLAEFGLIGIYDQDQPPFGRAKSGAAETITRSDLEAVERLYVMSPDHCPPELNRELSSLPQSRRFVVEDYSTMIRCLRMGMGGLGIAPALHRELDRHRRAGYLKYLPLAIDGLTIQVASISRKLVGNENPFVKDLLESFRLHLQAQPTVSGWDVELRKPLDIEAVGIKLEDMSHAYYLRSDDVANRNPFWRHAQVVHKSGRSRSGEASGKLIFNDEDKLGYAFEAKFEGANLAMQIKPLAGGHPDKHSCMVVSNVMLKVFGRKTHCLVGLWVGSDYVGNPTSGPFILSDGELPDTLDLKQVSTFDRYDDTGDLNGIARVAMLRTLTNIQARPLEGNQ